MQDNEPQPFPLFKGITRTPLIFGVPMVPLIILFIVVAMLAMLLSLIWWFIIIPFWFTMSQITKFDESAFRIWSLWFDTKWRNYSNFWQASTYTKIRYEQRHQLWE